MRLKGGDPAIFARLAEELAALEAAGVPYEIVPGVTAAQAASSHAGIPLTDRDDASCVAFVTGQECCDKPTDESLDYAALANFPGTLVFYMGLTTAPEWSRELIAHGKSADTPVAIVRRCTFADQQTIFTTLGEVDEHLGPGKLRPPAVVIVGDVARERVARKLVHRAAAVRPDGARHAARPSSRRCWSQLRALGADVLYQPAIEIAPPADWAPVDAAIDRLADFDWLVFSSSNGVEYFFRRLFAARPRPARRWQLPTRRDRPGHRRRARRVPSQGRRLPDAYRAEALAEALAPHAKRQEILPGPRQPRPRSARRNAHRRRRQSSRKSSSTKAATSPQPNPEVLEAARRRPHRLDHRHQLRHRPLAGEPVRRRPPQNASSPPSARSRPKCSPNWAIPPPPSR